MKNILFLFLLTVLQTCAIDAYCMNSVQIYISKNISNNICSNISLSSHQFFSQVTWATPHARDVAELAMRYQENGINSKDSYIMAEQEISKRETELADKNDITDDDDDKKYDSDETIDHTIKPQHNQDELEEIKSKESSENKEKNKQPNKGLIQLLYEYAKAKISIFDEFRDRMLNVAMRCENLDRITCIKNAQRVSESLFTISDVCHEKESISDYEVCLKRLGKLLNPKIWQDDK